MRIRTQSFTARRTVSTLARPGFALPGWLHPEAAAWKLLAAVAVVCLVAQTSVAWRTARNNWYYASVPDPLDAIVAEAQVEAQAMDLYVTAPVSPQNSRQVSVSDLLVDSIIQVESAGNPRCVGKAGERGLMQIKAGTWNDMTKALFGRRLPFEQAFDPETNRSVGRQYLAFLQSFLARHRDAWQGDERSLLLACYNAGPSAVKRAGFDPVRLNRQTQRYISKVSSLHDQHLAQAAQFLRLANVQTFPALGGS